MDTRRKEILDVGADEWVDAGRDRHILSSLTMCEYSHHTPGHIPRELHWFGLILTGFDRTSLMINIYVEVYHGVISTS